MVSKNRTKDVQSTEGAKSNVVSDSEQVVQKFDNFFNTFYSDELSRVVREGERSVTVDFCDLERFDSVLADDLLDRPRDVIDCVEEAITRLDLGEDWVELNVRFRALPETRKVFIRDLRADHLGKFICIEGIIRQASDVRPEIVEATYDCPNCGNLIIIPQTGFHLRKPNRCICGGKVKCICGRSGKFRMTDKRLVDTQTLVVEELPENLRVGEQARCITVFLRDDLVDPAMGHKIVPDTRVIITGVLRDTTVRSSHGRPTRRLDIHLDVNHVEPKIARPEDIEISPEDEQEIRELAANPCIHKLVRRSIAPSLYGHDDLKDALSLFLFGGVRKVHDDGMVTRGDIHVLLIGDLGLGKSALLRYIGELAPRGRYVNGKGATSSGLTASVVRDGESGSWMLEAGALALSSEGIVCIDDLDEMYERDRAAMTEAMEQQTITIAKGGVQAMLKAQTAVLAAARPRFGRFDPYQPPADQISLSPVLINRFDLIFAIRDDPDMEHDRRMTEHVLGLHASPGMQGSPPIKQELLRRYVAFARRTCTPRLSGSAVAEFQDFFLKLRRQYRRKPNAIPITMRQLESLVRMAEASARIRLSDVAEDEDAKRAIRLMYSYLVEVGFDAETGKLDVDRATGGMPAKERDELDRVFCIIRGLEGRRGSNVKIDDVVHELEARGIGMLDADKALEQLLKDGSVFETEPGFIKTL